MILKCTSSNNYQNAYEIAYIYFRLLFVKMWIERVKI